MKRRHLIFASFLLFLPFLSAWADENKTKNRTETGFFPSKVYLEKTSGSNLLNFDLRFVPPKKGSIKIVLFSYLDKKENLILLRRLTSNPPFENVGVHMAVFPKKGSPFFHKNSFEPGDQVFIAHPFEQVPKQFPVAFVKADIIAFYDNKAVEQIEVKVPVQSYEPDAELYLPFQGKWIHFQSHDLRAHHRQIYYQRNSNYFAIDFLKVGEKNEIVKPGTDGGQLSHFFSYNEPVLSPGKGTVVELVDSFDDAPMGGRAKDFDVKQPGGNFIIIKHGSELFTYIGHLKKGTFKVKVGDQVAAGQELAKCGNSGNSDAPHIHFHAMSKPISSTLKVHGLPIVFKEFKILLGEKSAVYSETGTFPGEILIGKKW